jgi:sodium transport system permease protein
MSWRNVTIVYRKELLDLLRDRRTIISMIVIPTLAVPLLMLLMGGAAAKLVSKARQEIPKVMVIGGADSPATTAALRELKTIEIVPTSENFTNLISEKIIRAAVEIPAGFDAALQRGESAEVWIYGYEGEMKSSFGAQALEQFFRQLRDRTVSERLAARQMPERLLHPFEIRRASAASPKKVSGNLIGSLLPYMIILMCMTGAMYPAVDLTAGEKERGTMETLLCSPVSRTHLVLGKCLMVVTASIVTSVLSLSSTAICFVLARKLFGDPRQAAALPLAIDLSSLAAVFVLMLPMAIFFSATLLAIALFARSSKEANSYLQPLVFLTIMPAVASFLPGVELNHRLAFFPVLNVSLLSKELLSGTYHWDYIAIIFGSTCFYAAAALALAVRMFRRESVLFRT